MLFPPWLTFIRKVGRKMKVWVAKAGQKDELARTRVMCAPG